MEANPKGGVNPNPSPKRPAAMFAVAVLLATLLSHALVVPGTATMLLGLASTVTLVGLLTRGRAVLLPAVAGQIAGLWLMDIPALDWLVPTVVILTGPSLAAGAIRHLRANAARHSHLVQTLQLYLAIAALYAPVEPMLHLAATPWLDPSAARPEAWATFASWVTIAMTGVVFVRGLLAWMPDNGGGFCPIAGLGGARIVDRSLLLALAALGAMTAIALAINTLDYAAAARMLSIAMFGVAVWACLFNGRRVAGTVLMATTLAILYVQLQTNAGMLAESPPLRVVLLQLQLLFGGGMLHLINALIEERTTQQHTLQRQAFTNEVSGMPNLRSLDGHLHTLGQAGDSRHRSMQFAEILVTGLHDWTNLAGYAGVMAVEREIGQRLLLGFGEGATHISHIGTGRYIVVLRGSLDEAAMQDKMDWCFSRHRFDIAGNSVQLRCSAALVDCPRGVPALESVLASLAIAQQKAVRNSVHLWRLTLDDDQVRAFRQELAWVEKVRELIGRSRLRLYAQPIAPAQVGPDTPLHFEILARLVDDDGTVLTPDKFLPAISRAGLHCEFDRRIVTMTLAYLAEHPDLTRVSNLVAINITGPTICDPGFAAFLATALAEFGIDGRKLAIEITESDSIADFENALDNVRTMAASGVKIAVDDFGTGQATFEYIRRLRPDILKIDGSFVKRYVTNPLDREIVQSIVRLARATGAASVAEFVESEKVAEQMREIGVHFLQGWAIAQPMPIERIKSFCDTRRIQMIESARLETAMDTPIVAARPQAREPLAS